MYIFSYQYTYTWDLVIREWVNNLNSNINLVEVHTPLCACICSAYLLPRARSRTSWTWCPISFFLSASTAVTYIFTAPTCTTTIVTSNFCALNAEFQHFIPRFNKTSLLCGSHSKRGDTGWKEAQRQGEDMMTLRKNSNCLLQIWVREQ